MITVKWLAAQFPSLTDFQQLAVGGQKWVFKAQHQSEGDVVVKLIKPTGDGGERVHREILAVQQVQSKRVPTITETGVLKAGIETLIWLREQRINGVSVRQVLRSGAMPTTEVVQLGTDILEALVDAERARIVHRDIKPDNVMRASDGRYWLLDFGIARHLDLDSLTATAAPMGACTLGYGPPEQFRNRKREIDARADLFALGVTLVECLTGRHPYTHGARDALEVVKRIESAPLIVPPIPGDASNKLGDLLRAMTQRRIDCRPLSATEALAWITEAAA